MSKSKSEVLNEYIKHKVHKAAAELAFANPRYADLLRECTQALAAKIAYEIANHPYGRMELEDIMRWKLRRSHWE